jgi:hypothetical protein
MEKLLALTEYRELCPTEKVSKLIINEICPMWAAAQAQRVSRSSIIHGIADIEKI